MPAKCLVVENELSDAVSLIHLLELVFPTARVLPQIRDATDGVFFDWTRVDAYVRGISDNDVIAFFDLGLVARNKREDFEDVIRGIRRSRVLRLLKPEWVFIAYTRYAVRAQRHPEYRETFDGLIDKGQLDAIDEEGDRVAFVKHAVSRAIQARSQARGDSILPKDTAITDSLGMRAFRAAFGDTALTEIVQREAATWQAVKIEALTSGYSGAFMLWLAGWSDVGDQSLVVKVARDSSVIRDEIKATKQYLPQLGSWAGYLTPLDDKEEQLQCSPGVYYRQPKIAGRSLLECLRTDHEQEAALASTIRMCTELCESSHGRYAERPGRDVMRLLRVDLDRLETSIKFLSEFAAVLSKRKEWPLVAPAATEIGRGITDLALSWGTSTATAVPLQITVQHGDLNPGNVMVGRFSRPLLIDLARLGHWHVGYDLSRLALMTRVRVMDAREYSDWFVEQLSRWLEDPVCGIESDGIAGRTQCSAGAQCDQAFRSFAASFSDKERGVLELGYLLGTQWDLIKVISYQDISVYKRLWAMIECWRLGQRISERL